MQIEFFGHVFDMNDKDAMALAARQSAEQDIASLDVDSDGLCEAFVTFLAGVKAYHIQTGATLVAARAAGADGISLAQALDQHNFVGLILGEPALDLRLGAEPSIELVGNQGEPRVV